MSATEVLSVKQEATLKAIQRHIERTGMPPSQRELMKALGITQHAVRMRLVALERKGFITWYTHIARGIVLTERGAA